jgi:hypothetical protein
MQLSDLAARVRGLDRLSMGLMKEVVIVSKANDPMLLLERQAYVQALWQAISGIEGARVVMAKAVRRLRQG